MDFIRYDELERRASKLMLFMSSLVATVAAIVTTLQLFEVERLLCTLHALIG